MDYCTGPSFASGGFIADSKFDGSTVINGSQQQWLVRNSNLDGWTNGVWNQVFSGVVGAPGPVLPGSGVVRRPVHHARDQPGDTGGAVPVRGLSRALQRLRPRGAAQLGGASWATGPTAGSSIPIDQFFIAKPTDSAKTINNALARGENLIFTPGVYQLDRTIKVKRADTVVLGLGFPTLVPTDGDAAMTVADVTGVKLAGLMFDAGPENSPVLLQVGHPARPQERPRATRPRCRTCSSASAARPPARPRPASS